MDIVHGKQTPALDASPRATKPSLHSGKKEDCGFAEKNHMSKDYKFLNLRFFNQKSTQSQLHQ